MYLLVYGNTGFLCEAICSVYYCIAQAAPVAEL